jgi:mono/diheme cytochrome c family protein
MRRIFATALGLVVFVVLAAAVAIWWGAFSVAATETHWPATRWVLETARVRSIKANANGIVAPANLADRMRIVSGTAHFADHCAGCHAAPGVPADDMAKGMNPKPPALTGAARQWTPGQLFWILRNGIKMSGMPAWMDHSDEELWDVVAFLEQLPEMSEQDYGKLIMTSMQAGGHMNHK